MRRIFQAKYLWCYKPASFLPVLYTLLTLSAGFFPLHGQVRKKPQVPDIIHEPYYPEWKAPEAQETTDSDKASERMLLQACRLLASGDTLGFERSYAAALIEAGKEDDFTRIFQEADLIFTPWERVKWDELASPAERAEFFRIFWKVRDPDPISFQNERLVNYYIQLLDKGLLNVPGGMAWIKSQMQAGVFTDPLPAFHHNYYGADFRGSDGRLEVEFYQSAPVEAAPQEKGPEAAFAFYDSSWVELARDSTTSRKITTDKDTLWFATHKVSSDSGKFYYVLRMDIPGHRAVKKNIIRLKSYSENELSLSGIILGTPSSPGNQAHSRRGVEILPKPSLIFTSGETIMIYFEIYGLKKDSEGSRSFREYVTVSLVKYQEMDRSSSFSGNIEEFISWDGNLLNSLTIAFDRQPLEPSGTVAEHFIIDTKELVPGHYRLFLQVTDNSNNEEQEVTWYFNLIRRDSE